MSEKFDIVLPARLLDGDPEVGKVKLRVTLDEAQDLIDRLGTLSPDDEILFNSHGDVVCPFCGGDDTRYVELTSHEFVPQGEGRGPIKVCLGASEVSRQFIECQNADCKGEFWKSDALLVEYR